MNSEIDWTEWYDMTRTYPPSELLAKTISYVSGIGKAIDIGGGALKDSRYLLEKGFDVTVIDSSPLLENEAEKIGSDRLHAVVASFESFRFPKDEYVLASAMQTLSYCEPSEFGRVMADIKASLKKGGIFCGQMTDAYDEESKRMKRAYQTAEEARAYLSDMEVLLFEEEATPPGRTKHWRIYNFIARK